MSFATSLLDWFDQHGRHDLPWQENPTPYRTWVSEIMLQQTQVKTVIPYYLRFMESFPTIQSLAKASQEQVLAHWAGLGYYARGRNLHKTAQTIVEQHKGQFPNRFEEVVALIGIGRSTAGAILSIAMQQRMPILDGNVKRVLCRFDAINSWSGNKQTESQLWQRAEQLTPSKRVKDYTQAIMDLGATVCTRSKPSCEICPVAENCQARQLNQVAKYPFSKPKKTIPTKERWFLVLLTKEGNIGLIKRPAKGIWGGLWSLPEFDEVKLLENFITDNNVKCLLKDSVEILKQLKHTFSHYHLMMNPVMLQIEREAIEEVSWFELENLNGVGLPTPIKKILRESFA